MWSAWRRPRGHLGRLPLALVDRLLPQGLTLVGQGEQLRRARLFASFCVVVPILVVPALGYDISQHGFYTIHTLINVALLALFPTCLVLYSRYGRERLAFNTLLVVGLALYFWGMLLSGGQTSEGIIWMPILPVAMAHYHGRRYALAIGAVCIAFLWGSWVAMAGVVPLAGLITPHQGLMLPIEATCAVAAATALGAMFRQAGRELEDDVRRANHALNMAGDTLQSHSTVLRTILDTVPHGVVVKDGCGGLLHSNRAFGATWLPSHAAAGGVDRAVDPYDHPEVRALLALVDRQVAEGEVPVELTLIRPMAEGGPRYIHIVKTPLREPGGTVTGVVEVDIDVTDRVRAEQRARMLQRMEAIAQVIGGVCHLSNNINQLIIGNLRAFKALPDKALSATALRIEAAVQRETELNERLLSYARGRVFEARAPSDAADAVEQAVGRWRADHAEASNVHVTTALEHVRCVVQGAALATAVGHLLDNAGEAVRGWGVVEVRTRRISLGAGEIPPQAHLKPGAYAEVVVRDTGSGMTPAVLRKGFEPFFTTKDPALHSGLGLSSVYGLAREAGGDVVMESTPRDGTTIRILLPASQARHDLPPTEAVAG